MRDHIQKFRDWRLGVWHEHLPFDPESVAERWPDLYLSLTILFTIFGYLLSLGFPLTAIVLLIDIPDAFNSSRTAMEWSGVLLEAIFMIGAGAMTVFLWRQKMPSQSGWPLDAAAREAFDELVESFRADARLSRPKEVRITERHQVSSVCVPRNGLPLFNRRVLLIGLPTLQALTLGQAETAVSRALYSPNTLRGWVLHLIACQYQCADQYHTAYRDKHSIAGRLMAGLFKIYWPIYQRWSQPALRWNELERDTLLNQQVCVDQVLELLAVDALVRRYLEERFWPALFDTAKREAQPPHPHAGFRKALRKELTQQVIKEWLAEAVSESEPEHSLRPAMSERLFNLGSLQFSPVSLDGENAANALLRESLVAVISEIDKGWRSRVRDRWEREHARHANGRACLAALQQRSLTRSIQGHHAMTYAKLARHYLPPGDAAVVYRHIAEMNRDDAKVLLRIGRLLLSQGIDEGVALVNRATRLEPRLSGKARKILAHFEIAIDDGPSLQDAVGEVA